MRSRSQPRILPPATAEQAAIAAHPLLPGQLIQVSAYAGAGKTTAHEHIAAAHRGRRIAYVCFNRANAEEGRRRMPGNVRSVTVHALAYAAVGWRYRSKLGEMRPRAVMDELSIKDTRDAMLVTEAMANFLHSTALGPTRAHVRGARDDRHEIALLTAVTVLWRRMNDPADRKVSMSHDGYLKRYTLASPILTDFDLLLVDEGQDLEPSVVELLLRQVTSGQSCVVMVGDSFQSLYGWRGAENAMETCAARATAQFTLTECFRFPQPFADAAAHLLRQARRVDVRLVGRGTGLPSGPLTRAFLARSNAALVRHAVALGGPMHFAATDAKQKFSPFGPYKFQDILDVLALWRGARRDVVTPYLRRFSCFSELEDFAGGDNEDAQDGELSSMTNLVKEFTTQLPMILRHIDESSVGPGLGAPSLSTGHRAKGLEWHTIELADDFLRVYDADLMSKARAKFTRRRYCGETNLVYVAITRAQCRLRINPLFHQWFARAGIELPMGALTAPPPITAPAPAKLAADGPGQGEFVLSS